MADDVDFADERIEKELASALAARVVYMNRPGFFRHSPSSLRNAFQTLPGTADC